MREPRNEFKVGVVARKKNIMLMNDHTMICLETNVRGRAARKALSFMLVRTKRERNNRENGNFQKDIKDSICHKLSHG